MFDFLELSEDVRERQLEQALIDDIQKLLLELGTGFTFYGRQKAIVVGGEEFFLDLLFYHHALRRFVIIELKIGKFRPEHVAKMNFYLNAVDEQLRLGDDRESVGIILCTDRNETVAKLALHRVYAPIAVSTWTTDRPSRELPAVEITDQVPVECARSERAVMAPSIRSQQLAGVPTCGSRQRSAPVIGLAGGAAADLDELAELDPVRTRLIDRVAHLVDVSASDAVFRRRARARARGRRAR